MSYREEMLKVVEQQLSKTVPPTLRAALQAAVPDLGPIDTAGDLVRRLRPSDPPWPNRDAALLAVLRVAQADPREWTASLVLLAAILPSIERLYRLRVRMRLDRGCGDEVWRDESWGTVQDAFMRAVARYPVDRRPRSVAGNLDGLTLKELKKLAIGEKKISRAQSSFIALAVPLIDSSPPQESGENTGIWEFARPRRESSGPASPDDADVTAAVERLDQFLSVEVIDRQERALLLANVIEGRSIAALAAKFHMTIAAIKGRLRRAKSRMRAYHAATPVRPRRRSRSTDENRTH